MDLLINTYGTRIRSSGERIVLAFPKGGKKEYPIRRLEKIIILRPSSISTGAVELALEHDVDIVYLGSFGKPVGRIFPSVPRGLTQLRRRQLEVASSFHAFELAKAFVSGKGGNQIAYLRHLERHHRISFHNEILRAETLLRSVGLVGDTPKGRNQLFGIEGYIAVEYFSALQRLYKFPGRKPQGRDKFNSALNYGYGILYSELELACLYVGLDPYLGLYHSERYGKPALILDLVEEFRVPLIDSSVFPLFLEKNMADSKNFTRIKAGEYQLSVEGKRKIVEAVFRRMHQTVRWQGKRRAIKSIISFQVQMLAHYFLGKKQRYIPFRFDALQEI